MYKGLRTSLGLGCTPCSLYLYQLYWSRSNDTDDLWKSGMLFLLLLAISLSSFDQIGYSNLLEWPRFKRSVRVTTLLLVPAISQLLMPVVFSIFGWMNCHLWISYIKCTWIHSLLIEPKCMPIDYLSTASHLTIKFQ